MHAVHRPDLQREPARGRPRAGLRLDLPAQRPPFRRPSAIPHSAVSRWSRERGGYDLMPEMGYRPTNKYLPPRPRRPRRGYAGAPARSSRRARGRRLPRAGSTAAARADRAPASGALDHPVHHRSPARAMALLFLLGARRGVRPARRPTAASASAALGARAGAAHRGPPVLDPASRPAGAGVAGLHPMALVLAVARGRGRRSSTYLPALALRARLARSPNRGGGRVAGAASPRSRGRDRLLHGYDLRLAPADPAMAQPLTCRPTSRSR